MPLGENAKQKGIIIHIYFIVYKLKKVKKICIVKNVSNDYTPKGCVSPWLGADECYSRCL